MRWLVVLECLARFLYEETNLHVALVPLLPVCRALAAWNTSLQDLLDNTIRVVAQYQLAFAVGPTAVTFMVRTGRRARRMPRRGHPEAIDMEFLAERGVLPEEVLNTMHAARHDVVCSADRKVVRPFFEEIDPSVLVKTIGVYQRMGCWNGDTSVPLHTYERLLDAFLYSGVITSRHPYDACIATVE
eukprot:symbB.v1.2.012644.t1/scaffold877.1/size158077/1